MLKLRPYQREAVDAIWRHFQERSTNPLIVLPTGTGKALTIATFISEAISAFPETRILCATHVKELVGQNYAEFIGCETGIPAGIFSAGLKRRDVMYPVTFCGIQSAFRHPFEFGRVDMLLVDEAHTIRRQGESMWGKFIAGLRVTNPTLKVLGFTATAYRLDTGSLTDGEDAIFGEVAYDYGLLRAVQEGYLVPVVPRHMATSFNLSQVHKRGGEYVPGELEAAMDIDEKTRAAVAEILTLGATRRSWLLFCSGVQHAVHVAEALRAAGITAASVSAETPAPERDAILADFKAGRLRAVTNANILTTGFNHPPLDLIAALRPTQSAGLWVQMLGRGMRLSPGKTDCLVLDFARNADRFGPLDHIRPRRPQKEEGGAPVRVCPVCNDTCFAGARCCPSCGFEFPPPELKIEREASDAILLSNQKQAPQWLDVSQVNYFLHEKTGKPDSIRVTYLCGLTRHQEWVLVGHTGHARERACAWWRARGGGTPPMNAAAALEQVSVLRKPSKIAVRRAGRYDEVIDYEY